jgi:hypothetical protein
MKRGLFVFVALSAALLQGCAHETLPDYPSRPTAVVRTRVVNHGFKGFMGSETETTVSTRDDRRREEVESKFTGMLMKHLVSARDRVVIWRADRDKQWRVDPKTKTYVECPLAGCPAGARTAAAPRPEAARKEGEPESSKPSCPLTLAKHRFSVDATGETREVNGFQARRYRIVWELVLQDAKKRKDTSLVAMDLWTTPENAPGLAEAGAVEKRFARRLREKTAEAEGLDKVVPSGAMAVISAQFLAGLPAGERAAAIRASRELAKIHGRPVRTHLEWNLSGNACGGEEAARPKKERSAGLDFTHGVSGLLGSAAGAGVEHEVAKSADKPVFAFDEDLLSAGVTPASDGLFVVPPSYKKSAAGAR